MKKLIWILLCSTAWAAPKTLTSSVAFTDPANNVLANGSIVLTLNQGAQVIGGGQLVQGLTVTLTLNSSGLITGSPTIWANDQLTPTGTVYVVNIYNSNGLKVRGPENWILSGASPIDLALETNVNLPDPGLGQPVLQNPSAAQTITGQSLTLTTSAPLTSSQITAANTTSSQSTTLAALTGAGSTATASCAGGATCTPDYGIISLAVSGSGIASGDIASVVWATAGDHTRICVYNVYDSTAAATITTVFTDLAMSTSTKSVIQTSSALTTAHTYSIIYVCH